MTPAELTDYVHRSRAAQGLPPHVEDPAVLSQIIALVDVTSQGGEADDRAA